MENFECPSCGEQTITIKQKLKASMWKTIFCPSCDARMCSNPIIMALMYFVVTWDLLFFGYMAIQESSVSYGIMMIVGWVILMFFIAYIPLNRMRSLNPKKSANTHSGINSDINSEKAPENNPNKDT